MSGEANPRIEGLWSLDAAVPGPHVAVTGLVHGDEPCGAVAIRRLLVAGIRPQRGRLSFCLVNPAARRAGRRFLDRDMNRLWRQDWITADGTSREAMRARELVPWLSTVDGLLDLHSTAFVERPFFVLAELEKARKLADRMAFPDTQQLMPEGCEEGRHLIDFGRFADPAAPAVAVTVECGRHGEDAAADVAYRAALRFLLVTGAIAEEAAGDLGAPPPATAIARFRTGPPCRVASDRFTLKVPVTGFLQVRAGEVVAEDGGREVAAPFDAVIISPRPAPARGSTAFYWARAVG